MSSLTRHELRRFGLTVGGVFLALGLFSAWRGHVTAPTVLGVVGGCLVVPALVWPVILRPVERGWMAVAAVLGHVNARIILAAIYYLIVTPVGVVRRSISDPLQRRLGSEATTYWLRRDQAPGDPAGYRKQF